MNIGETTEAPNWLVKLEEQREKRLKGKLGHEAGAGAPCQNCGDKCPGLDLHFWRKICKLCKCGKEDHDISDDDIYGFVQFQLLGSKPTKAKSVFLAGKKDAITLDWTPKGSNTDVKKYLEELPEELLPVKGSEAARVRKQRLQKQLPAHDIDATLCHALSPEEIQQLDEYVAHIRNHSVGQGKIIQLSMLRGEQHQLGAVNTQFINQQTSGQLSSSHPVHLQTTNLAQNLQSLSLRDKTAANNRAAFLNSQLPNMSVLETVDEQNPEFVNYGNEKSRLNYAPKSLHQIVDSQNPANMGKVTDLIYPVHNNAPTSQQFISDKITSQNPITGENYYIQNPEYSKLAQSAVPFNKNSEFLNQHESVSSEQYTRLNPEYSNKFTQNHPFVESSVENRDKIIDNKYKIPQPNANIVHSSENMHLPHQTAQMLGKRENMGQEHIENVPYLNQNVDQHQNENSQYNQSGDDLGNTAYAPNYERVPYFDKNVANRLQNEPYNPTNIPYDLENMHNKTLGSNFVPQPEYMDKNTSKVGYNPEIGSNYPGNVIQLPLTTSNVERHQEQFLNNDYPHLNDQQYKNRVPIPVYNAENKINPHEFEQNMSSVGFIRDVDYNVSKLQDSDLVNSNAVPTCHKCKQLFKDGAFAVSVDRTDSLWHAECFNCHTCAQPLADLLYFYHKETDDMYCGRDYALLKGYPRCAACDELIFVREYCLAEDRTFHIKHFCCFECDEPLAGKQYLMENNQPNCVDCYEKLKAEKCNDCGYVIGPEEQGVSLQGLHWHANPQCFACKHCRKALLGGKMLLRNQNLFCSDVCFKTYHA